MSWVYFIKTDYGFKIQPRNVEERLLLDQRGREKGEKEESIKEDNRGMNMVKVCYMHMGKYYNKS